MRDLVARVMDSRLADLLAQWRRGGTDASDPAARFAAHADHLLIIEAEDGANRYAHYGKAFADCFGNDLTGQVIHLLPPDILPADRRFMLEFEYGFVRRTGRPLWRAYTALFGHDLPQTWQRLVLPAGQGRLVVGAYPVTEQQLHHVVVPPVGELPEREDVDDVLVADLVDRSRLGHEPRDDLRRRRILPVEHLDRGRLADDRVHRAVHGAEPADAEQPLDDVLADLGAGGQPLFALFGDERLPVERARARALLVARVAAGAGEHAIEPWA